MIRKFSRKATERILRNATGNSPMFDELEGRILMSTYYVSTSGSDSGAGTLTSPWKTVQYAVNTAPAGSTIDLRGGTYTGKVTINKQNMTLESYAGETAKIVASTTDSTQDVALRIDMGGSGATLRNLDISGGYYYAIKTESNWDTGATSLQAAQNITIDNCKIHDSGRDALKIVPGSDNITVTNSEIYNTGVRDPSNADGVDAVNANNFVFRGNYIHNIATDGIYVKGGSQNTLIEDNKIMNIGWGGILLGQDTDCNWFDTSVDPLYYENINGIARNNLIVNTGSSGIAAWAALGGQFYNNTIVNPGMATMQGAIYITGVDHYPPPTYSTPVHIASKNITVENNIVYLGNSTRPAVLINPGGIDGSLTLKNNIYYKSGGTATFRNDQTGYSGGFAGFESNIGETGSMEADPKLAADYTLTSSSPAIDKGLTIAGFSTDFNGNARPAGAAWDIGAFEYGGTVTPPPPVASVVWTNTPFSAQTSDFTADVDAVPTQANEDTIIGLSNGAASDLTNLAAMVRFNSNGTIDVYNGSSWSAASALAYSAGTSCHVQFVVHMATHTYDVVVTPAGGQAVTLAQGYAFNSSQSSATSLSNLAKATDLGDATISGLTVAPVVVTPPPAVVTWTNTAFTAQTGDFTADVDAIPTQANEDTVLGLSNGAAAAYTDLAGIVRFNTNGTMDVRNGGGYGADATVAYSPGTSYHICFVVHMATHTYDVLVTPAGGQTVALATGYAFRTEQGSTSTLSNLAKATDLGDATASGLTVAPVVVAPPPPTVTWTNTGFAGQSSDFTADMDAVPTQANEDTIVGLSNGTASDLTNLAAMVRFNSNGTIDVYNGSSWNAASALAYSAGTSYHVHFVVHMATHTYDVVVTPAGGQAVTLAQGYAFSSSQASATSLSNLAKATDLGDATISGLTVAPVVVSPTYTPAWTNNSFPTQTGDFTAEFDAKPAMANEDTIIGLSNGPATTWSSMATIVRFNPNGTIDARNGGAYAAQNTLAYAPDTNYHVKMVVHMSTHTYDVYVTPAGGQTVTIGQGFAFRTEQAAVTSLNNWCKYNEVGDATVSNFTATPATVTPAIGTGLLGQYYDNWDFTNLKATRIDPTLNFNWGYNAPIAGMGADTYSIRWTGQLQPKYSQTYTFYVGATDGVRLWINGQLIINQWANHSKATTYSGKIALVAGQKYDIRLEHYDNNGADLLKFYWASASQAKEIVPTSALYPPAVAPLAAMAPATNTSTTATKTTTTTFSTSPISAVLA